MFWMVFGAATPAEVDADMTVLLLTGPVGPVADTENFWKGRYEEAVLRKSARVEKKDK